MPRRTREPESFLPLTHLTLHVLLALSAGPLHGYAIVQDVERRSDGRIAPGTGSFYEVMQALREEGLIERVRTPAGEDSRRRYYGIAPLGRRVLAAEQSRLERLVRELRALGLAGAS